MLGADSGYLGSVKESDQDYYTTIKIGDRIGVTRRKSCVFHRMLQGRWACYALQASPSPLSECRPACEFEGLDARWDCLDNSGSSRRYWLLHRGHPWAEERNGGTADFEMFRASRPLAEKPA